LPYSPSCRLCHATRKPLPDAVTAGRSCVDVVYVFTRNSAPRLAPAEAKRCPKMPLPLPSSPVLLQTTTNPSDVAATAAFPCCIVVWVLTRNSGVNADPAVSKRLARMPVLPSSGCALCQTTRNCPVASRATAGLLCAPVVYVLTLSSAPEGEPSAS